MRITRHKWPSATIKSAAVKLAAISIVTLSVSSLALADRDRGDHHHDHSDAHWHGNIHSFHDRDYHHWHQGHWYHGYRSGRVGWWWTVDDFGYYYPQPIYPYPDPYAPPVILQEPADSEAPLEQAPPPAQIWYYCNSAKNYYPYVSSCPEGWQTVPATPPEMPNQ